MIPVNTPRLALLAALAVALPLLLAPSALAQGELIVVDDVPDVADFAAPQTVAQLPGPDGRVTFREAVIAANNTPGPQTIHFNVPVDRWPTLYNDRLLLYVDFYGHEITDDSLTIDGTSQTAFTGDTNPDGNEVAFWGSHPGGAGIALLYVSSDHNTIRGLDKVHRRGEAIVLMAGAEHNRVVGNTIDGTTYAAVRIVGNHNTVGGTAPGEGNSLIGGTSGVDVSPTFGAPPPTGNRIVGNYLTGGSSGLYVGGAVGTIVGGPTPEERNVIGGAGGRNGEGCPYGSQVTVSGATDTILEGNYIGLLADGTTPDHGPGPTGVRVGDAAGTVIRDNTISGIRVTGTNHCAGQLFGWGLEVQGASDGTLIVGNRVGTSADGQAPVPNLNGIRVGNWIGSDPAPTNTTNGGTAPGDGNVVAYNERLGIVVHPNASGVAVLGNAVFENGQLGLDLGDDGPTANDAGDPDEGANRRQNHPAIESAMLSGATLAVTYAVDTAPANAAYPLRVEFFEADADAEEGMRFLGADTYTESDYQNGQPGSKTATLDVSGLAAGDLVLATATDAAGNTSEFGVAVAVAGGGATIAVSAEPVGGPVTLGAGGGSFQFTVTLTNTTGQPQSFQGWTAVTGPVDREPVMGPMNVTLSPGATLTRTLTQQVPGNAPAGTYTYHVHVGALGGVVTASDSFPFEKEGSGLAARGAEVVAADWSVSGWDEGETARASLSLPDGFALSAARPNPFTRRALLTLEVAEAQAVRAEVFDALGRRVAVLHDGALEAGVHALVFEGTALPAGLYVVRVTGETFVTTRRATLVR